MVINKLLDANYGFLLIAVEIRERFKQQQQQKQLALKI